MSQTYDVHYFINKFTAIPEERWTTKTFVDRDGRCCASGLCGSTTNNGQSKEAIAMNEFFWKYLGDSAVSINDDQDYRYQQPTPRSRILSALHDIATMQAVTVDTLMAECMANIETKGGPY